MQTEEDRFWGIRLTALECVTHIYVSISLSPRNALENVLVRFSRTPFVCVFFLLADHRRRARCELGKLREFSDILAHSQNGI